MRQKTKAEQFAEFLSFPEVAMMLSLAVLYLIVMALYWLYELALFLFS